MDLGVSPAATARSTSSRVVPNADASSSIVIARAVAAVVDDRSWISATKTLIAMYRILLPNSAGSGIPAASAVRPKYASTSPM